MSDRSASLAGTVCADQLRLARWVPAPSQLVRCGKDPLLQVVERMVVFSGEPGPLLAGSGLGGPGRGLLHKRVPRRGGSWRSAGEQFPEMAGLGLAAAPAWRKLPRQSCDESQPKGPDKLLIRPVEGGQAGAGSTRDKSLTRHTAKAVRHAKSHPAPPDTNPGRPQPSRPVPTCQDSQARQCP